MMLFAGLSITFITVQRANAQDQGHTPVPQTAEVSRLLDAVGIPSESVEFIHQNEVGNPPQVLQDVCYYKVTYKDALWNVGIDAHSHLIVEVWGQVSFVPQGREKPIKTYEEAIKSADLWFTRMGIDLQNTVIREVAHQEYHGSIWKVRRDKLIKPNIIVRESALAEIDGETGGLKLFMRDPEFDVPAQLPFNKVSQKQAVVLALEYISKVPTEYYQPSNSGKPISVAEFITWKEQASNNDPAKPQLVAHPFWSLFVIGKAQRVSQLPPEIQAKSRIDSVLWRVLVDAETGEVDVHETQKRNEAYVDGKLYQW